MIGTIGRRVMAAAIGIAAATSGAVPALAADCDARVVGIRSLGQYDHYAGTGFLAVRNGPGGRYRQVGELYRGDRVIVDERQGNWYSVSCIEGVCLDPYWGDPSPSGWVHGRYLGAFNGICPF